MESSRCIFDVMSVCCIRFVVPVEEDPMAWDIVSFCLAYCSVSADVGRFFRRIDSRRRE
jgi:hypothetical protein